MKKTQATYYQAPLFDVVEVDVEHGFSGSYGDPGEPGQDSGFNDFDGDL